MAVATCGPREETLKHEASDARAGSAMGVNHPTERSGSASMLMVGTGPLARVIVTVREGQRRP